MVVACEVPQRLAGLLLHAGAGLVRLHRSHDGADATGRCDLDPHAVVVVCEVRQRLTRRLLYGLLVAMSEQGVDEGGGIGLRLEGLEPRDSGPCLGSRL